MYRQYMACEQISSSDMAKKWFIFFRDYNYGAEKYCTKLSIYLT